MSTRRRVTLIVWLVGIVIAVAWIARRPTSRVRGLAWAEPVVLAAPIDGALVELPVSLHAPVERGDLVARFDSTLMIARRHVLLAELEALSESATTDRQGRHRLFERDREEAGFALGALTARVHETEARLGSLREQRAIDRRLFTSGIAPEEQALAVEREIAVVAARLEADREHLELARRNVHQADDRVTLLPDPSPWQVETARRELDEIEKRIGTLSLRSSIAGQVTEIYRRPGEWLPAGERIARIVPTAAREVHAWIHARTALLDSRVTAEIRRGNGERFVGAVESIGSERLPLPPSLWARSDAPEWGYRVRIRLASGDLTPGEPVEVSLRRQRS